jgi:hypothetical protein
MERARGVLARSMRDVVGILKEEINFKIDEYFRAASRKGAS